MTSTTKPATSTIAAAIESVSNDITINIAREDVQQQLLPLFLEMLSVVTETSTSTVAEELSTTTATTAIVQLFLNATNRTSNNCNNSSSNNFTFTTSDFAVISTSSPLSTLSNIVWPKTLFVSLFLVLILITIIGNTLVILAVLTTRRLRTVTNYFVLNLAITDWLVGTCVMPLAVVRYILGSWPFGWILCDIWISLDVLLCTGSILSLCAISLDRYLAVTQPLTYSKKRRSKRLAFFIILIVWITALCITCPPFLGWYEPGRREEGFCRYNQNKGYVVFSAMGSFFIPMAVMLYVYLKIGYVLTSRRHRIDRDANSERTADHDLDCDNFLSESEHFQCSTPKFPTFRIRWSTGSQNNRSSNNTQSKCCKCNKNFVQRVACQQQQTTLYELVEVSRLCATVSNNIYNQAPPRCVSTLPRCSTSLQFNGSRASFSETCLNAAAQLSAVEQQHQQPVELRQHHADCTYPHHPHQNHRVTMRISTTKRDTKTAKTLTIVMGGFIACWLPFFTYYLLIPFLPPTAVYENIMSLFTWIGWINCGINPFIYAFHNPDFRTAFWRLTCHHICRKKPTNDMDILRG